MPLVNKEHGQFREKAKPNTIKNGVSDKIFERRSEKVHGKHLRVIISERLESEKYANLEWGSFGK